MPATRTTLFSYSSPIAFATALSLLGLAGYVMWSSRGLSVSTVIWFLGLVGVGALLAVLSGNDVVADLERGQLIVKRGPKFSLYRRVFEITPDTIIRLKSGQTEGRQGTGVHEVVVIEGVRRLKLLSTTDGLAAADLALSVSQAFDLPLEQDTIVTPPYRSF